MKKIVRAALLGALSLASVSAEAASLLVDLNGELIGATGVDVNGTFYDVSFVDGNCTAVFSGCDEASDFAFSDEETANEAAEALLIQVFLNTQEGMFDTRPELTAGCEDSATCEALIPYLVLDDDFLFSESAINSANETFDLSGGVLGLTSDDFSTVPSQVFARFSLSAAPAVPEPASWAMMIGGFGLVGGAMRAGRKQKSVFAFA